jgi:hypothetical protein
MEGGSIEKSIERRQKEKYSEERRKKGVVVFTRLLLSVPPFGVSSLTKQRASSL